MEEEWRGNNCVSERWEELGREMSLVKEKVGRVSVMEEKDNIAVLNNKGKEE